jgi:hypothetical protein
VKIRDAVIGFIVLVVLLTGAILIRNSRKVKTALPTPTPSVEQKVTEKFGGLIIPFDVDKADLSDVSGGEGLGIVTRKFANGKFELTILADLPDPKAGTFYQAFLFKDSSPITLGALKVAKGGYMVDFTSSKDLSDYKKVVVALEGKNILEGSF